MKISKEIKVETAGLAVDLLAAQVPELSKGRLKDAMNKGAVIWRRGKQQKRLRRAQSPVAAGDLLQLNYDDDLLSRQCEPAVLLADERTFSLWYKPPGMLSQGNEWGDHLSLLRFAEQQLGNRAVFLIHRLDREASGLLLLAHSPKMATTLSQLMQQQQMDKRYQVLVRGKLSQALLEEGVIRQKLDGKACETRFKLCAHQPDANHSLLDIKLISGRKHQIRRHFAAMGHAVMGDPRYGEQNQDPSGLGLQAVELSFQLPGQQKIYHYKLHSELRRYG